MHISFFCSIDISKRCLFGEGAMPVLKLNEPLWRLYDNKYPVGSYYDIFFISHVGRVAIRKRAMYITFLIHGMYPNV